jgi:condensation enzyme
MVGLRQSETPARFPLSTAQEMWVTKDLGDDAGSFNPGFIMVEGLRITGHVDLGALQGALDDVVARHELLRTVIVRTEDPPYQAIYPPCPVPLEVVDLPAASDRPREVLAEEFILRAEHGRLLPRELPLLRGIFGRFDEQDSVLILVSHHTACDGWSLQLIIRDVTAFYGKRTAGRPLDLAMVRQYREYTAWEAENVRGPAEEGHLEYWAKKLHGARKLALPTDHEVPPVPTGPATAHDFTIAADTMPELPEFTRSMRCSPFMVVLSAINVLAYRVTGRSGWAVMAITSGRNDPGFRDTVGPFINFLPLYTDITGCASYREVVKRTRATCLEAFSHEIPMGHIDQAMPELDELVQDSHRGGFLLGMFQPQQFEEPELQIADGSRVIRDRELEHDGPDFGGGHLVITADHMASGDIFACAQFNTDDWDHDTVIRWTTDLGNIMRAIVRDPDAPPTSW